MLCSRPNSNHSIILCAFLAIAFMGKQLGEVCLDNVYMTTQTSHINTHMRFPFSLSLVHIRTSYSPFYYILFYFFTPIYMHVQRTSTLHTGVIWYLLFGHPACRCCWPCFGMISLQARRSMSWLGTLFQTIYARSVL